MSRLKILWVCVALLATAAAAGQSHDSLRVTLYFRVGETTLDGSYMDNRLRLDEFSVRLKRLAEASPTPPRIIFAEVGATASPEGNEARNRVLADRRAAATERLLRELVPGLDVPVVRGRAFEYDWRGLRAAIEADRGVPERTSLLDIIDNPALDDAERNAAVRRLGDGRAFEYLKRKMLGTLRTGSITLVAVREAIPERPVETPAPPDIPICPPAAPDMTPAPEATAPTPAAGKLRYRFALKTNLLFDAVGALNVGAEFPVGRHLSLTADAAYSYWRINNLFALQTIQGGGAAKWWFGERHGRLTGWNAGVYGMYCTRYDAQWRDGVQGDGFWSAGVSGGYALPISKRLRLEAAIAAGYIHTPEMRTYTRPDEGHLMWNRTRWNVGRVSLTKLQLNLVWMLGKEGAR